MSNEMLFGGYVDDNPSTSTLKFGLNQKVKLIKFNHNPNISFKEDSDGSEGIESEVQIGGLGMKNTIFLTTKAFDKNNNEITDRKHPDFIKAVTAMKQRIYHIAKCFATEEQIIEAVMQPVPFNQYVENIKALFPEGWEEKELDIFLQYQWQLREGSDRKYLEIPKKTKFGAFLIPHVPGNWKEVRIVDGKAYDAQKNPIGTVDGKVLTIGENEITLPTKKTALCYVNENNELHPFVREDWFMENGWGQADDDAEENLDNNSW